MSLNVLVILYFVRSRFKCGCFRATLLTVSRTVYAIGRISFERVYSSHESSSSQVRVRFKIFLFSFFFFFDYTNDVRAVTRNFNFPVGDIFSFSIKRAITSAYCRCFTKIHDNFQYYFLRNLHIREEHVPFT